MENANSQVEQLRQVMDAVRAEIGKVIVGQEGLSELLMTGLLSGGHMLIEGVPGIAKTLTARMLAKTIRADFSRIQFTPDLMPSDVIGTPVFNQQKSIFEFRKGPVFSNIVLIDEINRAPAKTQAALFEVMEEQQVTADGTTYVLSFPFLVVATQNPIEQEGTYKLPEAQLDRFLFRIRIGYPSEQEELQILQRFKQDLTTRVQETVSSVVSPDVLKQLRQVVESVTISDQLLQYIASLIHLTRNHPDLFLGASPRASLAIMRTSRAYAALQGRDFVIPDDIHRVAYPVLNHRIILTPDKELEGVSTEDVIRQMLEKVEVPR
ncbi:MAG: MoxR family ATPase [Chitinophagales bacterium]|nr:MoxR family ATPase [Chitinophagales bacterium]HAE12608.1 magnesium chelatase [Bacteroidota bacterium]MCB9022683.1 MoxR family ATPase [Chitinophagales bacterium]HAE36223.1 magnesium chelatase [Bacteroidota bacterium]HPR28275.1 MoxR family ATPase [Chitinophagales bacterium]